MLCSTPPPHFEQHGNTLLERLWHIPVWQYQTVLQITVNKDVPSWILSSRVFLFFSVQASGRQCITYLHSGGRSTPEPTELHALHAIRKVSGFSGGPHLKWRKNLLECWVYADEWESCMDYHILSRIGVAGQSFAVCNTSNRWGPLFTLIPKTQNSSHKSCQDFVRFYL